MKSIDRSNPDKQSELEIARRAIKLRNYLGISDKLYVDIIDILEFRVREFIPDFKLMVRRDIEMDKTASTSEDPPRIFVRETIYDAACEGDVEARRILTHELGHLLLHHKIEGAKHSDIAGYVRPFKRMTALDSTEDQADIYARNFLVPPTIAFEYRNDIDRLARLTGVPLRIAGAAATIARRQDMYGIRTRPSRATLRSTQ